MTTDAPFALSLARIATAALTGAISVVAARAFLRRRQRSLLALSVGAGLLAAGYLTEGVLVEAMGWSIAEATVLESVVTLVACLVLVASVFLRDSVRAPRTPRADPADAPEPR